MQLPTRTEINPHDDLDGRVACKHFFGKNLEQAEAVFAENGAHYGEDLMWMGLWHSGTMFKPQSL